GVAAVSALVLPWRLLPADARREATAFFGLAAGLTATLVSHAAASGDLRYVALDYLHVIAISIWLGGVVAFSYVVMPSARAEDPMGLGRTIWRFSLTALAAIAVIITTGTLQSLDRLVLIEDLVETPYGIALLAKIVLLTLLLGLGALNLLVWGPRMRRGLAASAQFWRGVITETALFAGVYVAEGSPTAMLGTWKVQVIVRLAGRPDIAALFTVPVSQRAGQEATTKIIAIPPYQLIVFSEPFQPQAGAPLTINVVVVDAKGDPVTGKKVHATFSGP